jgi:sec-independent protein translocase protein TatA
MGGLSITHWSIVLLAVILLFGARRLPDTARGLARSLRIFKSEMSDGESAEARPEQPAATAQSQVDPSTWPKLETAPGSVAARHGAVEQGATGTPSETTRAN